MYFLDILLDSRLLTAMLIFGALAALEPYAELWISRRLAKHGAGATSGWEYVGVPLMRAALTLGFVYCAYPALFGLRDAPLISALLTADDAHASIMLAALYVLVLFSSMLPMFNRYPAFTLLSQGILATAFLFKWMTSYLLMPAIGLWPGIDFVCVIALTAYLAHTVSRRLDDATTRADEQPGNGAAFARIVPLQAQLSVIVFYAAGLGMEIGI
jgi:hypothetical protein